MKRFINKKVVAIGMAAGLVLGGAGAAFALWSTSGSGSGSAIADSNVTSTVTASASTADTNLYPGDSAVPVHFTINNPNPYRVEFTTFSNASIASVTGGSGTPVACATTDFTLTGTSGSLDSTVQVPANTNVASGSAGSATILEMKSTAGDQCQGATVTVNLDVQGAQY